MGRISAMLTDPRTWTTLLYMLLLLPLGILYFVGAVVAMSLAGAFIAWPVCVVLGAPTFMASEVFGGMHTVSLPQSIGLALLGVLLLTVFLHLVRAMGSLHGRIAKALLVSREAE